jgi:fructose-specific component phosphotransferase system IIB-like protein
MEITLSRVVEAARQRRAAVTPEAGGYIVLLVVQRLATGPRQVTPEHIELTASGEIVIGTSAPAEPLEAERGLRRLLGSLLSLSHSAPPALKAAGQRVAAGSLAALEAELMAALIPINHAASGRALARLYRETQRATRAVGAAPGDSEHGSPVPSSVTLRASETPRPTLTPPAPPRSIASAPPVATLPAPPSAVESVHALPELEIDVDIVLGESAEGAAEVAVSFEELDVAVEELDVAVEDPDALLSEGASQTSPLTAPGVLVAEQASPTTSLLAARELSELSPFPSLASENDLFAETPVPDSSPLPADTAWDPEPPAQRSDLRELLNGYLAHTRCEEHMTADLRRRIGLEPWRVLGSGEVRN